MTAGFFIIQALVALLSVPAAGSAASRPAEEAWADRLVVVMETGETFGPVSRMTWGVFVSSFGSKGDKLKAAILRGTEDLPVASHKAFFKHIASVFPLDVWNDVLFEAEVARLEAYLRVCVRLFLDAPPLTPGEAEKVTKQWEGALEDVGEAARKAGYDAKDIQGGLQRLRAQTRLSVSEKVYGVGFRPIPSEQQQRFRACIRDSFAAAGPAEKPLDKVLDEILVNATETFCAIPPSQRRNPDTRIGRLVAAQNAAEQRSSALGQQLRDELESKKQKEASSRPRD